MVKSPKQDDSDANGRSETAAAVPAPVVSRLSLYLRELQRFQQRGCETVSSTQLGAELGFTDTQVRKDLAYFGQFGYPGVGYRCTELVAAIRAILGTDRTWNVALVGLGNLGRALLGHRGFGQQGFRITAAFDIAPDLVGKTVEGVPVCPMEELATVVQRESLKLAIVTVPARNAQGVVDQLIRAGIAGILNFAPVTLNVPSHVRVVGVDLALELEQLTYAVLQRGAQGG